MSPDEQPLAHLPSVDELQAIGLAINGPCACFTGTAGRQGCPVHGQTQTAESEPLRLRPAGEPLADQRLGWRCPGCGTFWSPDLDSCAACAPAPRGNGDDPPPWRFVTWGPEGCVPIVPTYTHPDDPGEE